MPPFTTPAKTIKQEKCPGAPIKKPKPIVITNNSPINKQLF